MFGTVKLVRNVGIDKYKYSGCGILFDRSGTVLLDKRFGKNIIIFGVNMGCSAYVNNKEKDILILCEGPTQRLDDTTITSGKTHSINFTECRKKLVEACIIIEWIVIYSLMALKFTNAKQKTLRLMHRKQLKRIFSRYMKKIVLNGYVYDFSVDYYAIAVGDTLDVHN